MVMVSLTGNFTVESVRKAEAQTELISVLSLLKKASAKAFSTGSPTSLIFSEDSVALKVVGGRRDHTVFSHLSFNEQTISFNRNGFSATNKLSLRMRGKQKIVDLDSLFGESITNARKSGEH